MGQPPDRASIIDTRVAEAWRDLGASSDPATVGNALAALYSEPHRVYHDLSHVEECMTVFDSCRALAERPGEVAAALLFHDSVYQPGAKDNEEESARLADRTLLEGGVPEEVRARVREMVLDTRHDRPPELPDSALVADIDLSGLAHPEEEFRRNTDRLLEEFRRAGIDDGARRIAGFLRHLLERDRIYRTAHFGEQSEEGARRNLRLALARLDQGRT